MTDDVPFYAPHHRPPAPRQPKRGALLFEFLVNHTRVRCELVDHGEHGVEAQFWKNEEFAFSRRFDQRLDPARTPRELAIAWAEQERKALERP